VLRLSLVWACLGSLFLCKEIMYMREVWAVVCGWCFVVGRVLAFGGGVRFGGFSSGVI
jgi:hypothetical protein